MKLDPDDIEAIAKATHGKVMTSIAAIIIVAAIIHLLSLI